MDPSEYDKSEEGGGPLASYGCIFAYLLAAAVAVAFAVSSQSCEVLP